MHEEGSQLGQSDTQPVKLTRVLNVPWGPMYMYPEKYF
jgi:hypothetical protein